jgi:hypothetical protein
MTETSDDVVPRYGDSARHSYVTAAGYVFDLAVSIHRRRYPNPDFRADVEGEIRTLDGH